MILSNTDILQFEHRSVLMSKLEKYDKENKTLYRVVAQQNGFHMILSEQKKTRDEVSTLLDHCIKKYEPKFGNDDIQFHRERLITILLDPISKL
jgi:hypothetical protein